MAQKKKHYRGPSLAHHSKHRRYAIILFYAGLLLILSSVFINATYIRPTNFKQRFRAKQLSDCLSTTTSPESCHKHFGY